MNELLRKLLFLPEQASTVARDIDTLHYFVILTTVAGSVAVAVAVFYFLVRYRERATVGSRPPTDQVSGVTRRDIPLWFEGVVISGLLGLFVLWWVLGFRQYVNLRTAPAGSMEVYVTGKKWMWSFAYPDGSVSNTVLYVPVGRPVKLLMSSRDVIHSFYVPEFRVKQDVVPGHMTSMWFEANRAGEYQILCAEYCGTSHSTMRGRVIALPETEYRTRMEALPVPESPDLPETASGLGEASFTLAEMGQRVATRYGCLRCHTVDGTPHIGPTFARAYGSLVTLQDGRTIIADEAYLTASMMDPLAMLHQGYEPVMPSYQGLLTAGEVGALVEYIRSLRDVSVDARFSPMPQLEPGDRELRIQTTPARVFGERVFGQPPEPARPSPEAESPLVPPPQVPTPFPTEAPELTPAVPPAPNAPNAQQEPQ